MQRTRTNVGAKNYDDSFEVGAPVSDAADQTHIVRLAQSKKTLRLNHPLPRVYLVPLLSLAIKFRPNLLQPGAIASEQRNI